MKLSVFVLIGSRADLSVLPALMDDEAPINKVVDGETYIVEVGASRAKTVVWRRNFFYNLDNALDALKDRLTVYRQELLDELRTLDKRLEAFKTEDTETKQKED